MTTSARSSAVVTAATDDDSVSRASAAGVRDEAADGQHVAIVAAAATRHYRKVRAVDGVSCAIKRDAITGVLGRNGSGKTTFMRLVAGHEFVSSGHIRVLGQDPVENRDVLRRMVFTREDQCFPDVRVRDVLAAAEVAFENWSTDLAGRLMADFDLPPQRKVKKLSRGMRSALGIVIGLAARAEVTLLDEPVVGLDPVARQLFYDHLLADYAEHPRTFLISTHLVDEIATLLEDVVVMSRGQVVVHGSVDDLRGRSVTVSGPADAVRAIASRSGASAVDTFGPYARANLTRPLTDTERAEALAGGLAIEPMTLQQLLVQHYGVGAAAEEEQS